LAARPSARFWTRNLPARSAFPVTVTQKAPAGRRCGYASRCSATPTSHRHRAVDLPVKPDRPPVRQHQIVDVAAVGRGVAATADGARPSSYTRSVVLA
jgi:hypothetical protein